MAIARRMRITAPCVGVDTAEPMLSAAGDAASRTSQIALLGNVAVHQTRDIRGSVAFCRDGVVLIQRC